MTWLAPVIGFAKGLVSPATEVVKGWQTRKKAKLASDLKVNEAITEAKIQKVLTGQQADIAWESNRIQVSGWLDDYWTIILSIPLIACFIPGGDVYVLAGFTSLDKCPDWYQWAVAIAISAAYGYKKFADFMALKKGD